MNAKITDPRGSLFYAAFIVPSGTAAYIIERFRRETSPKYPYRDEAKVTS